MAQKDTYDTFSYLHRRREDGRGVFELGRPFKGHVALGPYENVLVLRAAFPMFVPSLSW
jgi:hypothetical protein